MRRVPRLRRPSFGLASLASRVVSLDPESLASRVSLGLVSPETSSGLALERFWGRLLGPLPFLGGLSDSEGGSTEGVGDAQGTGDPLPLDSFSSWWESMFARGKKKMWVEDSFLKSK